MAGATLGKTTIGGVSKDTGGGYVNIGGIWQPIVEAYTNIGGVWKCVLEQAKYKWERYTIEETTIDTETLGSSKSNTLNVTDYTGVIKAGTTYRLYNNNYYLNNEVALSMADYYASYTSTHPYIMFAERMDWMSYGQIKQNMVYKFVKWTTGMKQITTQLVTLTQTTTQEKGDYIDTVSSKDNPNAYPDNGVQDGYWYVKLA